HRRAGDVVVVAGHAPAVRPGAGHGEKISGRDVGGQEFVLDHYVPGLTMFSHHPGKDRRGGGGAGGHGGAVRGVVEGGTDVVAHPAVDGDVGTDAVDVLDRAHLVQREDGRTDQRPAGLDGQPGKVQPVRCAP